MEQKFRLKKSLMQTNLLVGPIESVGPFLTKKSYGYVLQDLILNVVQFNLVYFCALTPNIRPHVENPR
jgi:hypothetical protein